MPYINPNQNFNLQNLNAPGSQYANIYNNAKTLLIKDMVKSTIFDATPQDYYDLFFFNMSSTMVPKQPIITIGTDEFFWPEMQDQRPAIQTPVLTANILAGSTQIIPVSNIQECVQNKQITNSLDQNMLINYVNPGNNTITVTAATGATLPQLNSGTAYTFSILGNILSDGDSVLYDNYRTTTIMRYNWGEYNYGSTTLGMLEKDKWQNMGQTDYLQVQNQQMFLQYKMDLSNKLWRGTRGNTTTTSGRQSKTMGGIYYLMQNAGSVFATTTVSNVVPTLLAVANDTHYGAMGSRRFVFGTAESLQPINDYYRNQDTVRYQAWTDTKTDITLTEINTYNERLILVPFNRFNQPGSFSPQWGQRLFLIDFDSIYPCYAMEEFMQELPDARSGLNLNQFTIKWIQSNMSLRMNNPLNSAVIDYV